MGYNLPFLNVLQPDVLLYAETNSVSICNWSGKGKSMLFALYTEKIASPTLQFPEHLRDSILIGVDTPNKKCQEAVAAIIRCYKMTV